MKKDRLIVRAATEADYPQIARLLDETFTPVPYDKRLRLWKWRHDDNPAGKPEIPPFIVGEKAGRIVGVHGLTPLRVKIDGRMFHSGCSCDLAVHPEARSAGMKIKLRAMKREVSLLPMSTSANEAASAITLALGGKDLAPARTKYIKVMRYSGLIGRRFGRAAGRLLRPLDRIRLWKFRKPGISGDARLEEVHDFDARFDGLWEIISGEEQNLFVRDSTYLNWRYSRYPFGGIESFAFAAGETVKGFAVIHSSIDPDGLPFVAILELFSPRGDQRTASVLLAEALYRARQHGADTITARTLTPHLDALYTGSGFKKRPMDISPYNYKNNTDLPDEQFDDAAKWYISLGDGDACYYFE